MEGLKRTLGSRSFRITLGLLSAGFVIGLASPIVAGHLHDRMQTALLAGQLTDAQSDARCLLIAARLSPLKQFEAVSDGHVALGLGCLELGDVAGAREHLLEAARASDAPHLNPVGVSQLLVGALLDRGEREAVLDYLEACRIDGPGHHRDLDAWIGKLRRGERPDFGPVLLH